MIAIRRLAEPEVLSSNKEKWTAEYLAAREKKPNKRPDSRQYAHRDVVSTLEAMSHHKCFYCEQSLKGTEQEVDHHYEVAEMPEKAFEWENLYLACYDCNRKKQPNKSIPNADCVDPCEPGVKPSDHLIFEDEIVRAKNNSDKGLKTIQKYKLNRDVLNYKRVKQLRRFDKALRHILEAQISEQRNAMTEGETDLLRRFRQADHPFSLMFSFYLQNLAL